MKYKAKELECVVCGKKMFGTLAKKFCSDSCRAKHNYKVKEKSVKCGVCGEYFKTFTLNKLYCSTYCKNKARSSRFKPYDRSCSNCGKLFKPTFKLRSYCSTECVEEKNKNEPIFFDKVCYCGKKFTSKSWNSKYCCKLCKEKKKKKIGYKNKDKRLDSCECCGFNIKQALHYHHINKTKQLGGITICANCHYIFHSVYGHKKEDYERDSKKDVISDILKIINI